MGYYTSFKLEVVVDRNDEIDYEKVVVNHIGHDPFEDESEWVSHEKDMKEISKKYPQVLFELKGEGEDSGDLWKTYFKNGKMQRCTARIVYDDFDEAKMR